MDLQEPMDLKDIQQLPEEEKLYSALTQISAICDKQRCHDLWHDKTHNEYLWKIESWDAQSLFVEEQRMQQWEAVERVQPIHDQMMTCDEQANGSPQK